MAYKDLIVLVDPADPKRGVLECAANLAVQHEAHLTGLYVGYDPLTGFTESQMPPDMVRMHQDNLARAEDQARQQFEEIARLAGISMEWRTASEAQLAALVLNARYSDLVMMSGTASDSADLIAHRYADNVVMAAGRPVLLFPDAYKWDKGLKRIMVAWDASRESSRALHDALPLLRRAEKVIVMEVTDRDDVTFRDAGSDVARHLARHDLDVESAHSMKTEMAIGDQLLSAVVDHSADMLVAGAYSHSRLREYALGGVTRHLMTHLTVPMLFSH